MQRLFHGVIHSNPCSRRRNPDTPFLYKPGKARRIRDQNRAVAIYAGQEPPAQLQIAINCAFDNVARPTAREKRSLINQVLLRTQAPDTPSPKYQ